jgi:hypothetical protein
MPQPVNRLRIPIRQRILIIDRVEHLEPQPIRLHTALHQIPQIPRVDIAPRVHFPVARPLKIGAHRRLVAVGGYHGAEPQAVNVNGVPHGAEPLLEAVRDALHADLAGGVDIHGFCGRGFGDGEVGEGMVALGVGDAVDGDGGREDDFLDAEFARGFYYCVRRECVDAEGFAVGDPVGLRDA